MKKLLLLLIALISATLNNAMESDKSTTGKNDQPQYAYLLVPNPTIAQTTLGIIARMRYHPNESVIQYNLMKDNGQGAILKAVQFDEMRKEYSGVIHTFTKINGELRTTNCQSIESQAEAKTEFDKFQAAFEAASDKKKAFNPND